MSDGFETQRSLQMSKVGFRVLDSVLGDICQPFDYSAEDVDGDNESASVGAIAALSVGGTEDEGGTNLGRSEELGPGPSCSSGTT